MRDGSTRTVMEELLNTARAQQLFPGAVVGVCTPEKIWVHSSGFSTYSDDAPSVTSQTIYDVASLTKTIPTSLLIWKYIEMGLLNVEQPVQELLPEWQGSYKDQVLLWHLLAQAVRYESASLAQLSSLGKEQLTEKIWQLELVEPPGNSYFYVNTNSVLQAWILERISGKMLQELAQLHFWKPLGMLDTDFFPSQEKYTRIAPTEWLPTEKKFLQGVVHDESARVLSSTGKAVGSAGIFSTIPDLLRFLQMLLRGGEDIFTPETLNTLWQPRQLLTGELVGLGWEYNNIKWMGELPTACFGKTGFTGCCCAIFPREKKGVVLLSNAVHPQRYRSRTQLDTFRQKILSYAVQYNFDTSF